ncbi:AAA family ATPase [Flavobacterium sp.]|jgi:RecA-family ATPase|uniref:AAA family ATPase n=1 Tax=Flavobacterium sp. TaxID=239 RepID=UPI0037BEB184
MATKTLFSDYLSAGFALVPLPQGAKGPVTKGWNQLTNCITDASGLTRIQYGVGLAHAYSKPVTCTLDVDDYVLASNWLAAEGVDLQSLLDAPDAVQIVSGKPNKAKLLYRLPDEQTPLATSVIKDGTKTILEFRCASSGGMTVQDVLPPSIHPDTGKPYEWGGQGHFSMLPILPTKLNTIWLPRQGTTSPSNNSNLEIVSPVMQSLLSMPETPENIAKVTQALDVLTADCSHDEWRDIIFALKSTLWNCAEDLARNWSMTAPHRWNEGYFNSLWSHAKAIGGIGVGTLFHKAMVFNASASLSLNHQPVHQFDDGNTASSHFELGDGRMCIPTLPPSPRDYAYGDTVPFGTTAILAGVGGTAKTTFVMQLAAQGALGKPIGNFPVNSFASMLFLGEENQEERDRRFGAVCVGMPAADLALVQQRVMCFPAAGKDIRLNFLVDNNLTENHLVNDIIDKVRAHHAECGLRVGLIVFDHVRLIMTGDPNAANDVTQLTRILTKIANATNSSVLVLAHSPKSSLGRVESSDASEVFGSGAFVDNTRAAFILNTMRPEEAKDFSIDPKERNEYVCLTTVKSNYGKSGATWWFKKRYLPDWQTITLEPVTLYKQSLFANHNALSQRIIDKVNHNPAQLSERRLRDLAGKNGEFKASQAEVMRSLDRLLEEGTVVKRPPTVVERKAYRISSNVKEVLVSASPAV